MEHGLSFLPDSDGAIGISARDYFDMTLTLSRIADQSGMSHIKMTEHYLKAYGGYCPNPLTFLAAVASVTSQIRLMTGCLLPVFHHPIQLAAETAMVDALSGGRLDVGFARAYLPYEFDAFGIDMDGSRERFDVTVDAVCRLWAGDAVSVDNEFFAFDNATCLPRPVQVPGPPVWIAAVMSRSSFVAAGKNGRGLLVTPSISPLTDVAELVELYRESFVPHHEGDQPRVLASLPLYVGSDHTSAVRAADPLLDHYLTVWAASADSWSTRGSTDYRGYTGMARAIRSIDPQRMRTVGGAVVGGPAEVVERISGIASKLSVDGFLWQVDFGGVDLPMARRSVETFVTEVLPQVS